MLDRNIYEIVVPTRWQEMKPVGDLIANSIVLATLLNWLPVAAAILSIIWGVLRIYETYLDVMRKRQLAWNPAVSPLPLPVLPTITKKDDPHEN